MLLADPELVSWKLLNKFTNYVIIHVQNSQECCFYQRKSPCRIQLAGQGLVKLNSGKVQFQILYIHCKPYSCLYKFGIWGLGGPRGLRKIKVFFSKGVVGYMFLCGD